jgi:hypothetical protein
MYIVLNSHNVAKYAELCLEQLQFIVSSTGNIACFKKSFTMLFLMLIYDECYKNIYT